MSVVTRPFSGFHGVHPNDRIDQNHFVFLRDTDRVSDENRFVKAPASHVAGDESLNDDDWSGLDISQTLGQLMTAARKSRNLSREQVAEQISTPAYYIRMIESDCYDAIPDQLYLLPFFERYANFLGLDASRIVARFISDFEKPEVTIVEAPASPPPAPAKPNVTPKPNLSQRWRRIAEAAVIVAVMLPIVGWQIGTMRTALHNRSGAAVSNVARPPAPIVTSDARHEAATVPAPIAAPAQLSAASQNVPIAHTQAAPRRRSHTHQATRRSGHLKRRIS
jgi:cytoskeletal protein RodZ